VILALALVGPAAGPVVAMESDRRNAARSSTATAEKEHAMMFALVLALIGLAVLPALDHCASH
jgi:hypothetical protein